MAKYKCSIRISETIGACACRLCQQPIMPRQTTICVVTFYNGHSSYEHNHVDCVRKLCNRAELPQVNQEVIHGIQS